MKRRDFLTVLGGAAVAWPAAARAQQGERMRCIGVILVNAENDPEAQARVIALRRNLEDLGWVEGRNVQIDYRFAVGDTDRAHSVAAELVSGKPDVILANGSPAVTALQRATRSIPVVFVVVHDPVGAGFVQSLGRPGANITGFSTFEPEIGGKWLEILKEVRPGISRVAGILDPSFTGFATLWRAIESKAPTLDLTLTSLALHQPDDDIESAVAKFAEKPGGGLIVLPTAINNVARDRIIASAARHHLISVYPFRHFASGGGLMSYGFDAIDLFRRGASYLDRILKGDKPADLPVQAPTKFELVINLNTAKAFGLTIPPTLLARADEVIE